MTSTVDQIRSGPMSAFQITAVVVCLAINLLDGFDILAIAFAAPEIAAEWSVRPAELGIIFSAGLAGMVAGALLLSPLADRSGRRPIILLCLSIISIGMLASAATTTVFQLIITRLITGLGVGGMLSSLTTMVAEYSSDHRRRLAISVLQSGYPVGAVIAGIASAYLLQNLGWRSIFLVGGTMSFVMIPLVLWRLPESVEFLLARRPKKALIRVNDILSRLGQRRLEKLPVSRTTAGRLGTFTDVFSQSYFGRTIAIWMAFIMLMSAFYFVTNWTPKILVDAGLSREAGISGGILIAIGGVVGGLLLGWLSQQRSINKLGALYMFLGILSMTGFGWLDLGLATMLPVAFLIGFFLAGAIISLYVLLPELYPPEIRNTGAGWALGVGRLGAVLGPYVAGLLIDAGWSRAEYYFALALPLVLSMLAVLWLRSHAKVAVS